ncbi:MAG: glycosyltransferase [Anaerolineae bacterium]|nr:glycosyltransferase [Anaerolineae bacterium]
MSDQPLVSVVIAVYNSGETGLAPALASLQAQTLSGVEVIIVDDGSTDETPVYLAALDFPGLRVQRLEANRGQAAALNAGIRLARGRYIARHDADDISAPERLERQAAFLDANPNVALLGSQVEWLDAVGRLVRRFDYPLTHEAIAAQLREKNSFAHGSVMFRREVAEAVGLYREPFRLAQDYDLWLRLCEHAQAANVPDVLYRMRFSPGMASLRRNTEQNAYAALARQLATERSEQGAESTDLEAAAQAIRERFARMPALARRRAEAANYAAWADRLTWWGGDAARQAWPVWALGMRRWPFTVALWKHAARRLLRRR